MEDIVPFDPDRMFWGTAPVLIYVEMVVRIIFVWLWTVLLLRWIGGRSVAQMSTIEFLLVIALGSAVGDPMLHPDVPLLYAMLVILLVVLADKAVNYAVRHWSDSKRFVDGMPTEIIRDGHILAAGLSAAKVGSHEIMELLRLKGICNLGEVRSAFIEPCGDLSIFRRDSPGPGLSLFPPVELRGPDLAPTAKEGCCINCGLIRASQMAACPECGATSMASVDGPAGVTSGPRIAFSS